MSAVLILVDSVVALPAPHLVQQVFPEAMSCSLDRRELGDGDLFDGLAQLCNHTGRTAHW